MASNFFLLHHIFKPGMAEKWWANMKNYDEAKKTHQGNQAKTVVYWHTFMPTAKEGPMFCIWEAKEGVSDSDFQNFIDGPDAIGVQMGLVQPLNNHCQKIVYDLIGGRWSISKTFLRIVKS